jgi:hypothetical protein
VENQTTAARDRTRVWDAVRYHPTPVVLGAVLGLLLGLGLAALLPNPQSATATVLLRPLDGNPYSTGADRDPLVALETEAQLVRSDEVSLLVIDDVGLTRTVPDLRRNLTTSVPSNTQVLEIEYTGQDGDAERISQSYAEQYLAFRLGRGEANREQQLDTLDRQIANREESLAVIAEEPESAARDSLLSSTTETLLTLRAERDALARGVLDPGEVVVPARSASDSLSFLAVLLPLLGLLVGLGLGVLLAIVRERSVSVVRYADDVEDQGAPVLTVVPAGLSGQAPTHDQRLALRGLATAVERAEPAPSSVAVAAVDPGVDSTALAAHLAAALVAAGRAATVVDVSSVPVGDEGSLDDSGAAGPALASIVRGTRTEAGQPTVVVLAADQGPRGEAVLEATESAVLVVLLGRTRREALDRALTTAQYLGVRVLGVAALEGGVPAAPSGTIPSPTGTSAEAAATAGR